MYLLVDVTVDDLPSSTLDPTRSHLDTKRSNSVIMLKSDNK